MADKFSDIPRLVKKAMDEMTQKSRLKDLGETAKSLVQKRTRLGGGSTGPGGSRTKLDPLSDKYRAQRKRFKKTNVLDSTTTPAKSNLTKTGEMLREIGVKISGTRIRLEFTTAFAKKKAKWVQDAGRKFFSLTEPERKQLEKKLSKEAQEILNKIK